MRITKDGGREEWGAAACGYTALFGIKIIISWNERVPIVAYLRGMLETVALCFYKQISWEVTRISVTTPVCTQLQI